MTVGEAGNLCSQLADQRSGQMHRRLFRRHRISHRARGHRLKVNDDFTLQSESVRLLAFVASPRYRYLPSKTPSSSSETEFTRCRCHILPSVGEMPHLVFGRGQAVGPAIGTSKPVRGILKLGPVAVRSCNQAPSTKGSPDFGNCTRRKSYGAGRGSEG
jgi:hypothetical protein